MAYQNYTRVSETVLAARQQFNLPVRWNGVDIGWSRLFGNTQSRYSYLPTKWSTSIGPLRLPLAISAIFRAL